MKIRAEFYIFLISLLFATGSYAYITTNVLQNDGFEAGTGTVADYWDEKGNASRESTHTHSGSWSAKLFGNWTGTTNYTLFTQPIPAVPSSIWRGEGWGAHFTGDLLGAGNRAGLQLAFWDENSNYLFGTMSPVQLHSGSQPDEWVHMSVQAKAPPGTAYACLNPLFRQCQDQGGSAWFDDCQFGPASTATLEFAGEKWRILEESFDWQNFENVIVCSSNCVWLDTNDWLHLSIRNIDDKWWCGEVMSTGWYGYGEYRWYTKGRVDLFDTNAILGLFTYVPPAGDYFQEIDIEITYAIGAGTNGNLHYTVQPWQISSNGIGFQMDLTNEFTTHKFNWLPGQVDYISYYGHHPEPLSSNDILAQYTFISSGVPAPWEQIAMNMWLSNGRDPQDTQYLEAVICDFQHTPFSGWILHDHFTESYSNGPWQFTDPGGSQIVQTNGQVTIVPNGVWQTAGLLRTNMLHWTTHGPVYSYRSLLHTIHVEQASITYDMQGVLALCSEPNNGWLSTNTMALYSAYDLETDTIEFSYFTKTNLPNSEGILRYRSLLTNATEVFMSGGIRIGFNLEKEHYHCELLDTDWQPLPLAVVFGSCSGLHQIGTAFCNGYLLLGAQNCDTGTGSVCWNEVAAGVEASNRMITLMIEQEDSSITLNWDDSYGAVYQISATTNLQEPFEFFHYAAIKCHSFLSAE